MTTKAQEIARQIKLLKKEEAMALAEMAKWDRITTDFEKARTDLQIARDEIARLTKELDRATKEIDILTGATTDAEAEIEDLTEKLETAKGTLFTKDQEIQRLTETTILQKARIEQLEKDAEARRLKDEAATLAQAQLREQIRLAAGLAPIATFR